MTTYLMPVSQTLDEALVVAKRRLDENPEIPWWEIRKGHDGFYVVPPAPLGDGRWGVDVGYESVGSFVGRSAR